MAREKGITESLSASKMAKQITDRGDNVCDRMYVIGE